GLGHEAIDHAVEHDAVVKSLPHQFLDPRHVIGRQVRPHLDGDGPLCGLEDQSIFGDSHALFSWVLRWVRNWTARGRPAMAPAIASVNGIGEQRCNASMTATR